MNTADGFGSVPAMLFETLYVIADAAAICAVLVILLYGKRRNRQLPQSRIPGPVIKPRKAQPDGAQEKAPKSEHQGPSAPKSAGVPPQQSPDPDWARGTERAKRTCS
jgi:hypothetical protein